MDNSVCPFCNMQFPSKEIDRHANDHLDNEQLSRDLEFAKQIALAPPSPPPPPPPPSLPLHSPTHCKTNLLESYQSSSSMDTTSIDRCGGSDIDGKICSLISLQVKDTFYHVEGGLMALLKTCLASESGNLTSILSGYVDHFQSRESEDVGWGCGWRNIQMLSSHLISQRQEARQVLYGGAGFVPDIASLQRWLELAWELGFDTQGSYDFDREIYGKRNWIGTTECAALLRSFGLRAMVVDFCSKEMQLASSTIASNCGKMVSNEEFGRKRKLPQVCGPMDRFLLRGDNSLSHQLSLGPEGSEYYCAPVGKAKGHGSIIDWVWNYFSDNKFTKPGCQQVVLSGKAPLYFQHDGHSRTIVGIQAKLQRNGMHQYNLLVLDPAHSTEALAKSLSRNFGWQKLIKRGIHTLMKPQYQLCFIEPGIASRKEIDQLKVLDGIHFEL